MKRAVVVSTNSDNNYLFFLPIIIWAWNKLGWDVVFCMTCYDEWGPISEVWKCLDRQKLNYKFLGINKELTEHHREETLVQCSRLYMATDKLDSFYSDYLLMISDVDMLPLSNYWQPEQTKITCYGKDQSTEEYSMCYVAMAASRWKEIMNLRDNWLFYDMKRDLDELPNAKSNNKDKWWTVDQQILTARLKPYEDEIVHIPRGKSIHSDYPIGRIDRSAWDATHKEDIRIDAHLLRPGYTDEHWPKILKEIIDNLHPTEDEIKWMCQYRQSYIELL